MKADANGSLLRWPTDRRLHEEIARRRAEGEAHPERAAYAAGMAALVAQLDKLCVTVPLERARGVVCWCGMVPPAGWVLLPERIAAVEVALGRPGGSLLARVRELELERDGRTVQAVMLAVAEVLEAQWAITPAPPPEEVPGTPEYRARVRAEIAADVAGVGREAAWMDRMIARDRAEREARRDAPEEVA